MTVILNQNIISILFSFTSILGDKRYSTEEPNEPTRKTPRLSHPELEFTPEGLFPDLCQLCGKQKIQRKNVRYEPYKITTRNSETAIKSAAKSKNEPMYYLISNLDIIAKDFKVHQPCYKSFTLGHYREGNKEARQESVPKEGETSKQNYSTSNYEGVKEYVNDIVINEKRPASMKLLHEIYGLGYVF